MKVATAFLASATALFANAVTASVIPIGDVSVVENGNIKRQSCVNTATSRECWGDYSIDTNWYDVTPDTGVIREYWLSVVNTTLAPDGYERYTMTFNGTIPGPALIGDWGDTFVIHVTNNLENNGTAIHWHGMRQLNNAEFDGVPGVTQCPLAPGESLTYTFPATQYGTTWYHSHYALQYAEGLYGPLIINGPTTANYGEDLGALMVADWDHTSVFKLWDKVKTGGPPSLDNTLLNGTNVYDCTTSSDAACLGTGKYFEVVFVEGTSYKLRIINAGTDMHFRFQIDAHNFQVVAMDLVPIVPYTTDNLLVAIGQRYDIIVNANATNGGDFWLRAVWQTSCGNNLNAAKSLGIVRYNASSTADPTTTPATTYASACTDEPLASLVPYYAMNATASTPTSIAISSVGGSWEINGGTLQLNWSDPTILMDYQNESIFPTDYNVFPLSTANIWVSFIITATGPGAAHPIHLHGHDFWILGQASTAYSATTTVLNYKNPPRRDVATLIPGGYLAIAFITDNPGSWLAHCHIAWHASESLAWQFVERESEITGTLTSADTFLDTCASWKTYYTPTVPQEDDSGI